MAARKKNGFLKKSIPQIVYGGVDGTISTFAVVAGAYGGGLAVKSIFILGVASLVADGFSMAGSAYLAAESASKREPLRVGIVTFLSFVTLGSMLLLPYLIGVLGFMHQTIMFYSSGAIALGSFAFVGALKSYVEGSTKARGALEVVLFGVIAAGIAYSLGSVLEALIT